MEGRAHFPARDSPAALEAHGDIPQPFWGGRGISSLGVGTSQGGHAASEGSLAGACGGRSGGLAGPRFCKGLCHLQAYNGHCEALKTLAETLVNLDVRDHKGRTALYLATEHGSTDCVEVLTSHGASALVKERKRKWTPLHAAGEGLGAASCLPCCGDSPPAWTRKGPAGSGWEVATVPFQDGGRGPRCTSLIPLVPPSCQREHGFPASPD